MKYIWKIDAVGWVVPLIEATDARDAVLFAADVVTNYDETKLTDFIQSVTLVERVGLLPKEFNKIGKTP